MTAQQADTLRLARKMLTELAGDDALSGRARAALSDAEAGLDRVLGSEPIEAPAPDWERWRHCYVLRGKACREG